MEVEIDRGWVSEVAWGLDQIYIQAEIKAGMIRPGCLCRRDQLQPTLPIVLDVKLAPSQYLTIVAKPCIVRTMEKFRRV